MNRNTLILLGLVAITASGCILYDGADEALPADPDADTAPPDAPAPPDTSELDAPPPPDAPDAPDAPPLVPSACNPSPEGLYSVRLTPVSSTCEDPPEAIMVWRVELAELGWAVMTSDGERRIGSVYGLEAGGGCVTDVFLGGSSSRDGTTCSSSTHVQISSALGAYAIVSRTCVTGDDPPVTCETEHTVQVQIAQPI